MPGIPGGFVLASERTGTLQLWNVSQPQPLELLNTGLGGIHSMVAGGSLAENSGRMLLSAKDGTIAAFDVKKRRYCEL